MLVRGNEFFMNKYKGWYRFILLLDEYVEYNEDWEIQIPGIVVLMPFISTVWFLTQIICGTSETMWPEYTILRHHWSTCLGLINSYVIIAIVIFGIYPPKNNVHFKTNIM